MASLTALTRRRALATPALLAAPAPAPMRLSPEPPVRHRIVIRDGWVLRTSDIDMVPADAA